MPTESLAELVRFTPDTYGFRYNQHVALFVTTDDGVVLVDPIGEGNAHTPAMIKEAIRSVTAKPVRYVVYSHSALDHSTGGAVFADTARFVGHTNAVDFIKAANDPATPPPDMTFDQKTTLELGGKRIDLYPCDFSAKDDYIVIHHPAAGVAMLVDIVQPRSIPFRMILGHPDRVIDKLKWIEDTLDFDLLVSGHTLPQMTCTKDDVAAARRYLLDLTDAIATARAAGLDDASPELKTMVRGLLHGKYGAWRRFDAFIDLNIEGAISWRDGNAHYPLDR